MSGFGSNYGGETSNTTTMPRITTGHAVRDIFADHYPDLFREYLAYPIWVQNTLEGVRNERNRVVGGAVDEANTGWVWGLVESNQISPLRAPDASGTEVEYRTDISLVRGDVKLVSIDDVSSDAEATLVWEPETSKLYRVSDYRSEYNSMILATGMEVHTAPDFVDVSATPPPETPP